MKTNRNDPGAYVRKVQEGTHTFTQDLLAEIERLQVLVAALEAEKAGLAERSQDVQEVLKSNEALRALAASLEAEMNRLHEQAISLRHENERHRESRPPGTASSRASAPRASATPSRYTEIEQQNSNLANLYVASYRLHGTLDRQEVIDTIQEIIANLVGSEEAGLFELDPATRTLELVASFGLPATPARSSRSAAVPSAAPRDRARSSWRRPTAAVDEADLEAGSRPAFPWFSTAR